MGADWRLWRLSWLIAWLFWWHFVAYMAWVLMILVLCPHSGMSASNISFVELILFLFGVFWGMCGENSCNVFPLLFIALWVPVSATISRRTVLMLWHAFLFLGQWFHIFLFSAFC
jgi:hypothetical protein